MIDKDKLVSKCAEIAADSDNITAFVLLWEKDGIANFSRDGGLHTQLGMIEFSLADLKHVIKQVVKE